MTASQATSVANADQDYVAVFPDLFAAITASRRIQWAIQGLAEYSGAISPVASILIDLEAHRTPRPDRSTKPVANPLLIHSAPSQILLTHAAAHKLDNISVLPVRPAPKLDPSIGLRELFWRGPESESTTGADDRALAILAERHGLADNLPTEPTPAAGMPVEELVSSEPKTPPATESNTSSPASASHAVSSVISAGSPAKSNLPSKFEPSGGLPQALPTAQPAPRHPLDSNDNIQANASAGFAPSGPRTGPVTGPVTAAQPMIPVSENYTLGRRLPENSSDESPKSSKRAGILIGSLIAAALLVGAVVFVVLRHGESRTFVVLRHGESRTAVAQTPSVPQPNTNPPTVTPVPQSPSLTSGTANGLNQPARKNEPPLKKQKADLATADAPVRTSKPSSACSLTPAQYQVALDNAWNMYQLRNYAVARTGFNSVLACDRQNQSAAQGLKRVEASDRHPDADPDQ